MYEKQERVFCIIIILAFVLSLGALGVISLLDENPVISEREQRELNRFPQFSVSSLLDGSFMSQSQLAYDDTFPFRDYWLDVFGNFRSAVVVRAGSGGEVIVNVDDDPDENIEVPEEDLISLDDLLAEPFDGRGYEQFASGTEVSGIIIKDDRGMKIFNGTLEGAEAYTNAVKKIKSLFPNNNVIAVVAPNSSAFYSEEKYHTANHDQKAWLQLVRENLKGVIVPDVYSILEEHKDEYIYFYTDHHWTTRGAYYAYRQMCTQLRILPYELEDMEEGRVSGFLGTFYTQTSSSILAKNPDYVYYYMPKVATEATVYHNIRTLSDGESIKVINQKYTGWNRYRLFTDGDNPFIIINTSASTNKTAILIKDSTGNAFVPWLCNHYSTIYVVDPRHVNGNNNNRIVLAEFLADKPNCDIILCSFIYNANNTSGSFYRGLLRMLK
ncbi:MAG: hypothetical protein J5887_02080 [Erysipelotrichaceae bacterium]|nr:hypothetical protein [Erysipelotrichaceae bacterium]